MLNMKEMVIGIKHYQLKNIWINTYIIEYLYNNSKSENIEIMINDKADEVTEELFESLLSRYQSKWFQKINES